MSAHSECVVCHEMKPKTYTCKGNGCWDQLCPACYGKNRTRCPSCRPGWSGKAVQNTGLTALNAAVRDIKRAIETLQQQSQTLEDRLESVESILRAKKHRGSSGASTTI